MKPTRPPSLTLRLTLLFSVVAVLVFSAFGWFIERSIEHHFAMEDDAELEIIARAVTQVVVNQRGSDDPATLAQRLDDILIGHHGAVLQLVGDDGQVLFASPGGPDLAAVAGPLPREIPNGSFYRLHGDHHTYRAMTRQLTTVPSGSDIYTMSIAVTIDHHLRFLTGFRRTLWLMIAAGVLAAGLMGWFAVRRGHAPLLEIVARIRQISAAELHTRLPPESVPRELSELAIAFNGMLTRLEEAFQRLSNFSVDIAHELRTPVTTLLTQTQVALSKPRNADEYREILYSSVEEYERMAQMINDMLFLAKAENGLYQPDKVDVDLVAETNALFEFYEGWADERGVALALHGGAMVTGDKLMLRRLLSNLLSNAIRHTPPDGTVAVRIEEGPERGVSVSVDNPGTAIPEEHIPRLFDRFYRAEGGHQQGGDGAGLGLAIAKSIVELHGGTINATSNELFTRFQAVLPQAQLGGIAPNSNVH